MQLADQPVVSRICPGSDGGLPSPWEAASASGPIFLRCTDWKEILSQVLERVGMAFGAKRGCVTRNCGESELVVAEWSRPVGCDDDAKRYSVQRLPILVDGDGWGAITFDAFVESWSGKANAGCGRWPI